MSGFMPRHIEQPASATEACVREHLVQPLCSACSFTSPDPGTTIARTLLATFRPRTTSAATRRSSMREFVQLPRNTRSSEMSCIAVPGVSPM
jgi:hypothetical protein